jgi:hypothetical protein
MSGVWFVRTTQPWLTSKNRHRIFFCLVSRWVTPSEAVLLKTFENARET